MNQLQLPLSFEDFIPENHLVRVVNTVVDSPKLKPHYDRYKEGGCPAYHPGMMLKVMIYSFSQKTYSSRQIAKALRENINFMWIAGGNKPDFRTINRFRLDMKDIIEDVFYEVVKLLIEKKYIKLQNYFLDGTKIEANANKYTFVWNKSVDNYDRRPDEKIKNHLREIDRIVAEENEIYLDDDLEEKNLGSYVKHNKFHWEKKKKNRENPYLSANLPYSSETDSFVCRNGKQLLHVGKRKYVTEAGYETIRDYYWCEDYSGCPYAAECKNTNKNRTVQVSHRLNELKRKANENLCSEKGLELRSQRVVEVEQVFGRIKGCWSFRRFHLR